MSGSREASSAMGVQAVVVLRSILLGGDVAGGLGEGTGEREVGDGWDDERDGQLILVVGYCSKLNIRYRA